MLAANDNGSQRNLQIAVWKMLRAGMPTQIILSTLCLTASDLAKLQTASTLAGFPVTSDADLPVYAISALRESVNS